MGYRRARKREEIRAGASKTVLLTPRYDGQRPTVGLQTALIVPDQKWQTEQGLIGLDDARETLRPSWEDDREVLYR
jgi:hypothetical protein